MGDIMSNSFFVRRLTDDILYWATPVPDGFGGSEFSPVSEIKGYWDEKQELFVTTESGEQMLSRAIVYLNQDVTVGGYLMQGTITNDLDSSGQEPETEGTAYRIMRIDKQRDMKAVNFVRKIWLR